MNTRHLILLPGLVLGSLPGAFAETSPAATSNPILLNAPADTPASASTSAAENKPVRPRAVSNEVAASISAAMPKYNPPPKKPEPKPEEELADLRETDKPRNGIIRLPTYMVQEKKPVILKDERDVYTKEGLAELARRRYITDADGALNRYSIPLFSTFSTSGSGNATTDRALTMYAEDERLRNMADLKDSAALVSASDKAAGAYVKREAQKTYQRRDDFGWNGGSVSSGAAK